MDICLWDRFGTPNVLHFRTEPATPHAHREQREQPTTTQQPMSCCPRGDWLRALQTRCRGECMQIRSFHTEESLLLPYGRPKWNADGNEIVMPPVLQRAGCSSIAICREPMHVVEHCPMRAIDVHGSVLQIADGEMNDFTTTEELFRLLSSLDAQGTLKQLLIPSTIPSTIRLGLARARTGCQRQCRWHHGFRGCMRHMQCFVSCFAT